MNDSWYRASVPAVPPRAQLQGVLDADVCIVGAGFTGLSAALELAEAGRSRWLALSSAITERSESFITNALTWA